MISKGIFIFYNGFFTIIIKVEGHFNIYTNIKIINRSNE
jgi:hypothetical protein